MRTKSKSLIITEPHRRRHKRQLPPIHPGEMLREEFMVPMGLSANALAIAIGVPATRIGEIVNERRGISGDTALRLARYFRMSAEFWMNMQSDYELESARYLVKQDVLRSIRPAPIDKKTGALKTAEAA